MAPVKSINRCLLLLIIPLDLFVSTTSGHQPIRRNESFPVTYCNHLSDPKKLAITGFEHFAGHIRFLSVLVLGEKTSKWWKKFGWGVTVWNKTASIQTRQVLV